MMKRGEIYYANLDPTVGAEIRKKRPVVIISSNANNEVAPLVTMAPITSNVKKIYPFEVMLETKDSGLSKPSKIQCHQIRAISKLRVDKKMVGKISNKALFELNMALKTHLDLI